MVTEGTKGRNPVQVGTLTIDTAVEGPKSRLHASAINAAAGGVAPPGDLVRSARTGDENAMQRLLQRVEPEVRRQIQARVRDPDDVDDLVQETMILVWRSVGSFRGLSSISTWVFRIARNAVALHRRSEQRRQTRMQAIPSRIAIRTTIHPMLDARERLARVVDILVGLPPAQRDALVGVVFGGMTTTEAAAVLGVRPGTIRSNLHKARKRLLAGNG